MSQYWIRNIRQDGVCRHRKPKLQLEKKRSGSRNMDGVCLEQQANVRIKTSQKVTLSPTLGNETACVCVCVCLS